MNDSPRQTLRELVGRFGPALIDEPRRCEGLLRDFCGEYRREISVLLSALGQRVASDLLRAPAGIPRELLLARLTKRLSDNVAMSEDAARWAVESWALALGVVSGAELESMKQPQTQAAVRSTAAAQVSAGATPAVKRPASQLVVSAKGDGDYTGIGEALSAAAPGARLLVRPGLYHESLVIDQAVEIIGDGHAEDIIVRSTEASCIQMKTDRAFVRGLTLRGRGGRDGRAFFAVEIPQGRLTLEDCDITSDSLSCVAIHGRAADPVVRRCRIHDGSDSGVYIFDGAAGQIEDCQVFGHANVGVAVRQGAKPVVRRCKIYDGKNAGLVIWEGGAGVVEDCEVFGNHLTGVGINEGGDPVIRRCRIHGGGNSGVFVHQHGHGTIEDCEIYGNAQAEVAVTQGGYPTVRGCEIHSGKNHGIFVRDEGRALVKDCDIHSHAEAGVVIGPGGAATLQQCNVNGNGLVAVKVDQGGAVRVEHCDLRENHLGAWEAERGAVVETVGNIE